MPTARSAEVPGRRVAGGQFTMNHPTVTGALTVGCSCTVNEPAATSGTAGRTSAPGTSFCAVTSTMLALVSGTPLFGGRGLPGRDGQLPAAGEHRRALHAQRGLPRRRHPDAAAAGPGHARTAGAGSTAASAPVSPVSSCRRVRRAAAFVLP